MPLVIARETEILMVETAALREERAAVAAEVRKAEEMLKAAEYGALAEERGSPLNILMLDGNTVAQIRSLAVKLEDIARRAGHVGRCKSDPVAFFYQISACYEEK